MSTHLERKYLELQADRDEWKRRALKAEEALSDSRAVLSMAHNKIVDWSTGVNEEPKETIINMIEDISEILSNRDQKGTHD